MTELLIDAQTCIRCGECREICPMRVITLPGEGLPRYVDGGEPRCILCGHCESLCPTGAIQIMAPQLDPTRYPEVNHSLAPNQLGDYLRMRRSIRRFRPEPVERARITEVLDLARYAPTGTNSQRVQWLVIHDTTEVRRLTGLVIDWMRHAAANPSPLNAYFNFDGMIKACERGNDPIGRNAPHLLIAHAHREAVTAKVDAYIALAHLDIIAPAFGLGSCWGGFFQFAIDSWPPLKAALELPEGHEPYYAMLLGTPAVTFRRPPKRNRLSIIWR